MSSADTRREESFTVHLGFVFHSLDGDLTVKRVLPSLIFPIYHLKEYYFGPGGWTVPHQTAVLLWTR